MFVVLLFGVKLKGLETDGNADLSVGVHHTNIRLYTVPTGERVISTRTKGLMLPLGSCGFYFETNFFVRWVFQLHVAVDGLGEGT